MTDWYLNRSQLLPDMVFRCLCSGIVRLDRRVPGDGSKWYAASWNGYWCYDDTVIEPGDLEERLPDDYSGPPT